METTRPGGLNIRFAVKGDALYAIILGNWPGAEAVIALLSKAAGKIEAVSMLGNLNFTQNAAGLKVNPPTWTALGNPQLPPGVNGN